MTAPALLLAKEFTDQNPVGMWMSEKLDGVRAFWDGSRFLSRDGNEFVAPEWFKKDLPQTPLDGELWAGRGNFGKTLSKVRAARGDWTGLLYVVFDAPACNLPFEARQDHLRATLPNVPHVLLLEQERVESVAAMQAELARVEALGGEGLMLRAPGSKYVGVRSATLLKVKTFHDAEAVVVGYEGGKGRHAGRMGAAVCRLPNGIEFSVGGGWSDKMRDDPPAIGTTITFKYQELTPKGKPRFNSFLRVHTPV